METLQRAGVRAGAVRTGAELLGDPHLDALRHEPIGALVAGDAGLSALTAIVAEARFHVSGWLLLEHGWNQAAAVHKLLSDAGATQIQTRRDLSGHVRCSGGRFG